MRSGRVFPQPRAEHLICGKEFLLLPTPTVTALTQSMGYYMRSKETWERTSNLGAYLIGLEYGLTGHQGRPSGKHIADVSFAEWMMGVPTGWTMPEGEPLADACRQ
jgi:hypothetical protein